MFYDSFSTCIPAPICCEIAGLTTRLERTDIICWLDAKVIGSRSTGKLDRQILPERQLIVNIDRDAYVFNPVKTMMCIVIPAFNLNR